MLQLPTVDLTPALIVEDMPAARDSLVRALHDLCGAFALETAPGARTALRRGVPA